MRFFRARWWLRLLLIPLGALVATVCIELVLRPLPVTKGLYPAIDTDRSPLPRFEPHLEWTHSMGWDLRFPVQGKTNNYGQVSPFDYQPGHRAIGVFGDSFIESQLNVYPDSLQGRLAGVLGPATPVYSFGMSGNSLSDYLPTAQIAARDFAFDALVFLVVDGDIVESFDGDPGHYYFAGDPSGLLALKYTPRPPLSWRGRLLRKIDESSLLYYSFANLRFRITDLLPSGMKSTNTAAAPVTENIDRDRHAVDFFLGGLEKINVARERVVLVLDCDRYAIYDANRATRRKDPPSNRSYLANEAMRRGFQVIDMAPIFEADYRVHRTHFDFFPLDRHLNAYGNALTARSVAERLQSAPNTLARTPAR